MTRSSATREAILGAAEGLFGERGFSRTTLEDVAFAADVSRPLVYRYFGDKKELFALVVRRVFREWNEVLQAEVERRTSGTEESLRRVLIRCLEFARSRTVLRGLLVRDSALVRTQVGDVLDEGRGLLPELIQGVLVRGVERGDVRTDLEVEDLAHVVSEVFVSYTLLILAGANDQVSERRTEAVIETLLRGVIAARSPRQ